MPDGLQMPFPAQETPVGGDIVCESGSLVPKARNVSGKGKMTLQRYVPVNDAYYNILTQVVDGQTVGRNPLEVPVETLTRAGHGRRSTHSVVAAMGDVELVDGLRRYGDLKRQCDSCVEFRKERLGCVVIDCPIWPYRTGRNPHNPRRGKNPFKTRPV